MKWKTRYIRYKKLRRRLSLFLLIFFGFLFASGYLIFKSSVVQTKLTNQIGKALSEQTNAKISVEKVDFKPFDTFVLKGLLILDHHDDTLLFARDFYIEINDYDLDKRLVKLELLELNEADFNIKKYKGERKTNLKYFLAGLIKKKKKKRREWSIYIEDLGLEELKFTYEDENKVRKTSGVDFKNLELNNVNADFSDVIYHEGLLSVNSDLLTFKEKSGFEVIGLQGNMMMDKNRLIFKNFELETPKSDVNGEIKMEYEDFNAFKHFNTDVVFLGEFEETTVECEDIAYFAPRLKGIDRKIEFKGDISGTIVALKADQLLFSYGKDTKFEGNITIKGLPNIRTAIIQAEVRDLETYEHDLKSIPLPPFGSGKTLTTPKWVSNMGKMVFQGQFSGKASHFEAFGLVQTTAGKIRTDVSFSRDTNNVTQIIGKVKSESFDLGKTLGNKSLGVISLSGELDALVKEKRYVLKFSGDIPRFEFKDYAYSNIKMDGEIRDRVFSGELLIKDTNLVVDFDGEIDFSNPKLQRYDFVADLKRANLNEINWVDKDSAIQVSGKVNIGLTGNNIEDMNGVLRVDDIVWKESGKEYELDSLELRSIKQKDREMIILNSDWFMGKIEGNYNLKEIYPTIINVFSKEIPSIVKAYPLKRNHNGRNKFRLMFKVYNYDMIHELFTPDFNISKNSRFSGRFDDDTQSYLVQFATDSIQLKNKKIEGLKLYSKNKSDKLNISAKCKFVQLFDTIGLHNIKLKANIESNILDYQIGYKNISSFDNYGDLTGEVDLNDLNNIKTSFGETKFVYRDTVWTIDTNNSIVIAGNNVKINNFKLSSIGQYLSIDGTASPASRDFLKVKMNGLELGTFKYFWDRLRLDIVGNATGDILFRGVFGDPVFTSNLSVNRLILNNQVFGKIDLSASFVPLERKIDLELFVKKSKSLDNNKSLKVTGGYYPYDDKRLDLHASLNGMKILFLEKYFDGVFSDFKGGETTGNLHITGNLKHPEMKGVVNVNNLKLKVDYLNVNYKIDNQDISFKKDTIIFDDFVVSHDIWKKSKGHVNGLVTHTGFKKFRYNIDHLDLKSFYCLNTTANENQTYYGQAFVEGLVNLKGDGITNYIGGNVSTISYRDLGNSGVSNLTMPLDQTEELELSEFVRFVDLSDTLKDEKDKHDNIPNLTGLELDFNFKINREALVSIIFDPAVGDEIKANGHGAIGMQLNSDGKFRMYGDFEIDEGDYYFTLQRIIGRKFIVKPGSKMSWDGDPLDATINMHTYYRSRANLIDLVDSTQIGNNYQDLNQLFNKRISVNTDLLLNGSLWKPDVEIGITLPNGTPEENNHLESYIIGEDEINRQAFTLLLASHFIPPVGSKGLREDGINQGIQVIEGQLNNALSNIWEGVDLGVDYNTNSDDKLKDEIRLLAGFQYKKFTVRTDYDLNRNVGDIEADFKITNNFKAKAYHKITNDEDLGVESTTPTNTSGLGVSYQKSFNSFKDLFRRKKAIKPTTNKTQ
jgi:hypothetical protein